MSLIKDPVAPAASVTARRRWPWTALAGVVALAAGGIGGAAIEHSSDQVQAAGGLYRAQVESTLDRIWSAERQLAAQPVAQRDIGSLNDVAASVAADQGLNGGGTLTVSVGEGSAAAKDQVIFAVTVSSPHGTTVLAAWFVIPPGYSADNASGVGACVLASTLLGSGRATQNLNLGDSNYVPPCPASYWTGTDPSAPNFQQAGIHQSPEKAARSRQIG